MNDMIFQSGFNGRSALFILFVGSTYLMLDSSYYNKRLFSVAGEYF
jgi:hypothetical protein